MQVIKSKIALVCNRLKSFILDNKVLMGIFFIALSIRYIGITYGFPIIFNMDEESFVRSVTGLRFSLNPNRFDWPHTHFYLNFVFYMLFYYFRGFLQLINVRGFIEGVFPILWQDPHVFYLLSRLIAATMGALTVFPVFLSAKELFKSKKLALYAGLLFVFIPFHVIESHVATLDVAMTFWVAWFLYFSLRIIKNPSIFNFLMAGVFSGLAWGTKYNAIFYYLVFAICVWYSVYNKNIKKAVSRFFSFDYLKKYTLHLVSFLGAWLITNPAVLIDFDLFWSTDYGRGFLFQFENIGSLPLAEYPISIYNTLYVEALASYGLTLYLSILFLVLLFLFFNYRSKTNYLSLLLVLFMYFFVASRDRNPPHYFVFLYPLIVLAVVKFLSDLSEWLTSSLSVLEYLGKEKILISLFSLVMLSPIVDSVGLAYKYSRPDTRNLAYNWLQENLTEENTVYYYGEELERIPYADMKEKGVERVDGDYVDKDKLPFYLFLGQERLKYEDLMEGDRDTEKIEGNTGRFLKNSELMYYKTPQNQFGPPVFIFKINGIDKE